MARTKIDRRIIKTKRAISLALLQLLSEKGVDDITITELTTKADINRKTFYLHYTCIADVADELTGKLDNLFHEALDNALTEEREFIPAKFFEFVKDKIAEQPELFRAFCAEQTCTYFVHALGETVMNTLMGVYRSYTSAPDTTLRLSLIYMASGVLNIYLDWVRNPSSLSMEDITALALRLVERDTALLASNT